MTSVPELDLGESHTGQIDLSCKDNHQQKDYGNTTGVTAFSIMRGIKCHHCDKLFSIGEKVRYCSTHREEKHGHVPFSVGFLFPDDIITCDKCHKSQNIDNATTTLVTSMRSEGECPSTPEKDKECCKRHKFVKFSI